MNSHLWATIRNWKYGTSAQRQPLNLSKLTSLKLCQSISLHSIGIWWSPDQQTEVWVFGTQETWKQSFSACASTKTKLIKSNLVDKCAIFLPHQAQIEESWYGTLLAVACLKLRKKREMVHLSWFSFTVDTLLKFLTFPGTSMKDWWWPPVQKIIYSKSGKWHTNKQAWRRKKTSLTTCDI